MLRNILITLIKTAEEDKYLKASIYKFLKPIFLESIFESKEIEKENELLTIECVCRELNISKPTVFNLFKKGLPRHRVNNGKRVYIKRSELNSIIKTIKTYSNSTNHLTNQIINTTN